MMKENTRYNLKDKLIKESFHDSDEFLKLRDNPGKLIDKGYEYIDSGDYKKAFKLFTLGAKTDRTDPDLLNGLGICLCEMGKLNEAKQVLEYAIEKNPDDPVIYANIAGVLWEQMEYDMAIYYYNKSLEIDPGIEETCFNLINLYIETGSLFMAFIECNKFMKAFPDNKEALVLQEDIILNLGISFI